MKWIHSILVDEFLEPRLGPCFLPTFCIRGKRLTTSEVFTKFIVSVPIWGNVAKSANAIKFVTDKQHSSMSEHREIYGHICR
jgi:hypothetical protein